MGHFQLIITQLQAAAESLEGKVSKVEGLTKNLDEDSENLSEAFDALQSTAENVDNSFWWNTTKLRGLK